MSSELDASALSAARRAMVDRQIRPADVTRLDVLDAILATPREAFAPKSKRDVAYMGDHLEIAPGRFELDPRLFAKMLSASEPAADDLAMIVGAGGGYAAAVMSRLTAAVVAVEPDAALNAMAASGYSSVNLETVIVEEAPLIDGCAKHAPYNLIFVNGASARGVPDALLDQLAEGGRLVLVAMDGAAGRCELHLKSGGVVGARAVFDAVAPVLPGLEAEQRFEF